MIAGLSLMAVVISVVLLCSNYLSSGENGLVGYWEFNQGKGNIARDSSGKGNDGTIEGATWVEGKIGKALEFDGIDDYVDCGNNMSLDITGAITIEAWVKFTDVSQEYQHILEKGPYGKGGFRIFWNYKGTPHKFYFATSDGTEHGGYTSRKILQNNVWYHIACVDTLSEVYFYLNAQRETLYSGTHTITETPYNLYIGKRSNRNFFNGTIDDVRIYSRALTESEIKNHYMASGEGR